MYQKTSPHPADSVSAIFPSRSPSLLCPSTKRSPDIPRAAHGLGLRQPEPGRLNLKMRNLHLIAPYTVNCHLKCIKPPLTKWTATLLSSNPLRPPTLNPQPCKREPTQLAALDGSCQAAATRTGPWPMGLTV